MTTRGARFGVLWLAALVTTSVLTGCHHNSRQTMSGLWGSVPQVRWSGRAETPVVTETAEPSVSANNAATASAKDPLEVAEETDTDSLAGRAVLQVADSGDADAESGRATGGDPGLDPFTNLEIEAISANEVTPSAASSQSVLPDSSTEQLERLKAAINDDAEREDSRSRSASGGHDVRLRVESMLEKARRLFDLGQLREARYTAKLAQEIGDLARLDFSPEEERPADLVQRIDDHLAGAGNQEPPANQSLPDPASVESGSSTVKTPAMGEDDAGNRQRRDWSGLTVFRRDRRETITDPKTIPAETEPQPSIPLVQLSLETDRASEEGPDGAVVQANRSLSLIPAEGPPIRADVERESLDHVEHAFGREPADMQSDSSLESVASLDDSTDEVRVNPFWTGDRLKPPMTLDEDSPPPADFEDRRPNSAFHEIDAPLPPEQPLELTEPQCSSWGVPIAAALFSVCAIVAVFWYRRGAT